MSEPPKRRLTIAEVKALPQAEQDAYILSIQTPETQRRMTMTHEERVAYYNSPLPDCQVRDKDGNIDVGERRFTARELMIEQDIRQKRGKYISEVRGEIVDPPPSISKRVRDRAIRAFNMVKQSFKDLMKSWGLASEKELEQVKNEK